MYVFIYLDFMMTFMYHCTCQQLTCVTIRSCFCIVTCTMYTYVLYLFLIVCCTCVYVYSCVVFVITEKSLDLDIVPKTEKLDNQVVTARPKMPHNPPSRSYLVSNMQLMFSLLNCFSGCTLYCICLSTHIQFVNCHKYLCQLWWL